MPDLGGILKTYQLLSSMEVPYYQPPDIIVKK